ncbi:VWA domain-containing protein [Chelatococcus sp. SYSU_G07232]|uniref:VWA domain-containing protein n=1 Tax=Chelatococcus albus TaxID=3047466 RepID=A0ABT7ACW6_9HYPH|nr:VWA domain-containing protein [Chelatococcus sp. SYSU_G07232]MDJ1157220.1 VWA domain-containing protein [Chelatococcus sp. SYSU_G07232]
MARGEQPKPPAKGATSDVVASSGEAIDAFLSEARAVAGLSPDACAGRLVFALDATMSRQPTWDLACSVQAEMFEAAGAVGGLAVQLVYFRGYDECRASSWVTDARALTGLMDRIACRGGHTQIGRVLRHVRKEAGRSGVRALVYVGDAMEEPLDDLCAVAGELGLLGVKAFVFHEGQDPVAGEAFRQIAQLTGGAYARFDARAPQSLAALLRAAAAYASGGLDALRRIADHEAGEARKLLAAMSQAR